MIYFAASTSGAITPEEDNALGRVSSAACHRDVMFRSRTRQIVRIHDAGCNYRFAYSWSKRDYLKCKRGPRNLGSVMRVHVERIAYTRRGQLVPVGPPSPPFIPFRCEMPTVSRKLTQIIKHHRDCARDRWKTDVDNRKLKFLNSSSLSSFSLD